MKGNYDWVHVISNAYGWIADNSFLMWKGQFVDAENCDIRNNIPFVELIDWASNIATPIKEMYCGIEQWMFWESGYWYDTTGTNFLQTTNAQDIVGAARYNGMYIWWDAETTTPQMGKVLVSDATGSSDWTLEASYSEDWVPTDWDTYRQSHNSSYGVSSVIYNSYLYFSNGNQVLYLDNNDVVYQWLIDLPYDVVGITAFGSRIRVYLENGQILFWDGISGNFNESIDLGETISLVTWKIGTDTVITRKNTSKCNMWQIYWYDKAKIKDNLSWFQVDRQWKNASSAIAYLEDIVYFPWGGSFDGMYTYWKPFVWIPESLNLQYALTSNGNEPTNYFLVHHHGDSIFVCWKYGTTIKIDKLEWWSYTSWYITHRPMWEEVNRKKALAAVEVHWYFPDGTSKLVVDYTTNGMQNDKYRRWDSPTWTELFDTSNGTDTKINRYYWTGFDIEFYDIMLRTTINTNAKRERTILYWHYIDE